MKSFWDWAELVCDIVLVLAVLIGIVSGSGDPFDYGFVVFFAIFGIMRAVQWFRKRKDGD